MATVRRRCGSGDSDKSLLSKSTCCSIKILGKKWPSSETEPEFRPEWRMLIWEKNAASRGCDSNAIQRVVFDRRGATGKRSWPVEGRTGPRVGESARQSRDVNSLRTGRLRAGQWHPFIGARVLWKFAPARSLLAAGRSFLEGFELLLVVRRGAALLRAVQGALRVGRGLAGGAGDAAAVSAEAF